MADAPAGVESSLTTGTFRPEGVAARVAVALEDLEGEGVVLSMLTQLRAERG